MKTIAFYLIASFLILVGVVLLILTNSGIISFRKSYIDRLSTNFTTRNRLVVFQNVNVVPMDSERILKNQTVVIREGVIEHVGDSTETEIPEGTLVIDAAGQYLMPGLVDMHVHVKETNELLLFVANGVTAVRDMWGTTGIQLRLGFPDQLKLREQIDQGQLLGPTMYIAGPVMEGPPATMPLMPVFNSPEAARKSVAWQAAQGYDFVKVYDQLSEETYREILNAAQEHGLPVIGHTPKKVGLEAVLAGGQISIEHLTGYIDPDAADFAIPEDELAHYAEMTREAGVWNCPTIGIYQKLVPDEHLKEYDRQPGMAYVSPRTRALWMLFLRGSRGNITYKGSDYPSRIAEIYTRMTRALHDAGARVILGTDTDNPYVVPGFSLHDELEYLVQAGFTPFEAIEAGTRNAAEALGALNEFGTISPGKRADLILVQGDPLKDVANARKRVGVMLRGNWLPEPELQKLLGELMDSYTPTIYERVWPLGLIALPVILILRQLVKRDGTSRREKSG
jgi:imidazolonepropionase-like amidohydrolase